MASATRGVDGRYIADAPEPVGEPTSLLARLHQSVAPGESVLLGFDFPIGVPLAYADRVGVTAFLDLLPQLGQGTWATFYEIAQRPDEVGLHRPFYPRRPGRRGDVCMQHLVDGLGVGCLDDLRRVCERAHPGRRAASSLFWTLGAQQVGRAAISGWRDVLAPGLQASPREVVIWPFAGPLAALMQPGRVVVAETYPAEYYGHLGVRFPPSRPGLRSGKQVQAARVPQGVALSNWAEAAGVGLSPRLQADLQTGFGVEASGEDPFDATVGLLGMLNVLLGGRPPGEPEDSRIRAIEGWILGRASPSTSQEPAQGIVGVSHRRVDALEKVTGRAAYITDLGIPGAAHAKIWRSPVAHARIRRIDTAAARACPGVLALVTAVDLTFCDLFYGPAYKDQPILAVDRVRYAGEPVVAVVAEAEGQAQAALAHLDVEFDELPAVTTLEEALAPGAPVLHERLRAAGQFRDLASLKPTPGTNICHHFHYGRGDAATGFAASDEVFEDVFRFPMIHHYSMEPHVAIARVTPEGITVWGSTQHPFPVRKELAEIFRLPLNQVQVIVPHLGGAFGNKSYTKIEPLAVALARIVGRPVRLALSTEEAFKVVRRAAARVHLKTGVRRDGTIVARQVEVHFQIGAYADVGPRVAQKAGLTAAGPYRAPNLTIDSYAVYSNTVCTAAFRGYGVPQTAWGYESQMDIIADRLGIDPLEIRCRNFPKKGETYIEGDLPIDADFEGDLRRLAATIGWPPPAAGSGSRVASSESEPGTRNQELGTPGRRRRAVGQGLACVIKAPLAPSVSNAMVRMHADGSVTVLTGTVEFGQGSRTIMSQIVAEELGVPLSWVRVGQPEMGMSPYDQATSASRSTTLMGLAIQNAARDVRDQILEIASGQLKTDPTALRLSQGAVQGRSGAPIPHAEIIHRHFGMPGGELIGRGTYRGERGHAPLGGVAPFWEVGMAAAEVEVDEETGQVRLLRYVTLADVGKAINPLQCEAQEEGATMMGIGHTFFEEMVYEGGQLLNPTLIDYRIPAMIDLPDDLQSILVENGDGPGPYGAKGIGESGLMPTSPAVANAIAHATGVRITELPLTPERVFRALRAHRPSPTA